MVKIYKYEIKSGGVTELKDRFVGVLKVDWQGNKLFVWCLVAEKMRESQLTFLCLPTGYEFPYDEDMHYLDSVHDGPYVWHVFFTLKVDNCKRTDN